MRLTLLSAVAPRDGVLRFVVDGEVDAKGLHRLRLHRDRLAKADLVLRSPTAVAEETSQALGLEQAEVDPALRDREHGSWAGKAIEEVATDDQGLFAHWLRDPDAAAPGGESVREIVGRAHGWLGRLEREHRHVVAVTHPPIVRACLAAVLSGPPDAWFAFDIAHGTATVLTRDSRRWRIALVNAVL